MCPTLTGTKRKKLSSGCFPHKCCIGLSPEVGASVCPPPFPWPPPEAEAGEDRKGNRMSMPFHQSTQQKWRVTILTGWHVMISWKKIERDMFQQSQMQGKNRTKEHSGLREGRQLNIWSIWSLQDQVFAQTRRDIRHFTYKMLLDLALWGKRMGDVKKWDQSKRSLENKWSC